MAIDENTHQHCYQKGRHNAESNIHYNLKSGQEPHDGLESSIGYLIVCRNVAFIVPLTRKRKSGLGHPGEQQEDV
jgi:hypothetical protein